MNEAKTDVSQLPINQVLCGDCVEVMKTLPDESVDMTMFSPPYWGLRDYGSQTQTIWNGKTDCAHEWTEEPMALIHENRNFSKGTQEEVHGEKPTTYIKKYDTKTSGFCSKCGAWKGQLGLEPTPQLYIIHMTMLCGEVKRVLKRTGSMYIVIGDTYYGSGVKDPSDPSHGKMTRGSFCAAAKASQAIQNKYQTNWLQPKQLLGIPWRVAIALQEDGWLLRNDIIWNKPNHMPSSVKDRLSNAYEHIFHFVKIKRYYYDLDAIREPHKKPFGDYKNYEGKLRKSTRSKVIGNRDNLGKPNHLRGKNPSDVYQGKFDGFGIESEKYGSPRARTQRFQTQKEPYIKNNPHVMRLEPDQHLALNPDSPMDLSHPLGKNPSDVLLYDSKYAKHEYGQTLQAFVREQTIAKRRILSRVEAEKLFPDDPKKQQEYINYIYDHDSHSSGKNPADFWNITTKPFKGAHFAVYPEEVCVRPIKSSCPEFLCDKCGKPRTRITNVVGHYTQQWGQRKSKPWFNDKREMPQKVIYESLKETLGWSDCGCGAGFHNGVVLDPMCGSGTTLAVAKKLGRKYIGVELNPQYIEIAQKRLAAIPEKITTFF